MSCSEGSEELRKLTAGKKEGGSGGAEGLQHFQSLFGGGRRCQTPLTLKV